MQRLFEFIFNHYVYSLALIVVTYLLIQEFVDTAFKKFKPITPMLAVAKINDGQIEIIDVRDEPDFVQGHIENARNFPLGKLSDRLNKLPADKQTELLIVCQNGTRSLSAAKMLAKAGYQKIYVITGGMDAWTEDYKFPIAVQRKQKANA